MLPRILTQFALLSFATAFVGCGDEAPPPPAQKYEYTLQVRVIDTQGVGLPKAPVTVDDQVVGHTDADGKFLATLNELEGSSIKLAVLPIEGYRYQLDGDSVSEVLKTAEVGGEKSGVPILLETIAASQKNDYLVWFKAVCEGNCGGWPVTLDGKEVSTTNELGYAHFSFTEQPGKEVEVEITTPEKLKPANPRFAIELERDATLYRIEQPFTDPTKPKPRKPKRSKRGKKGKKGKKGKTTKPVEDTAGFLDPTPPKKNDGAGINLFD